jgi:capsular polysaccharide transport system permease protein
MKTQLHEAKLLPDGRASPPALAPQIELVPLASKQGTDAATTSLAFGTPPKVSAWRRHGLFICLFVFPLLAASLYFGFIASDVYVSETKFILRSPSKADMGALSSLSQGQVSGRSDDDAYALIEYVTSRDAARAMELDHGMRDMMARPEADLLSRYPSPFFKDNQEHYYKAYRQYIDVTLDSTTGIVTLLARAYRPQDAKQMATALLQLSDTFVNGLDSRANRDAQYFAKGFLAESKLELVNVEAELASYRNDKMVLDPGKESDVSLTQLAQMTTEISKMEAALAQQQSLAPNSPSVKPLSEQIRAYREQIEALRKTVVGNPQSVVSKLKDYELLTLQRDIAGKKIELATAQFEKTRQEAQNRRVYLQTVVEPSQPDTPQLPYRLLTILGIAGLGFVTYRIAKSLMAATMEHEP